MELWGSLVWTDSVGYSELKALLELDLAVERGLSNTLPFAPFQGQIRTVNLELTLIGD